MAAKKVLVVDDCPDILRIMKQLLVRCGYDVMVADCCRQALTVARSKKFEVVLTDVVLPDADGYDLIRRIKKEQPQVKTVAITGFANEYRSLEAGADAHITKPVNVELLRRLLRHLS